ncbi:MAG: bifunctional (p)ppGpp synthetase/guanosine-3',5'-bis(diphosphate) 3'-pyrophosphohydrolase, partial [Proteobacteria bacterium]|nr:bifunctional (p)ppGpp synthetase/guanosine-3',5'-bis(diphosphate) 3'-pyrophosphohydrolase [Pseudomonadota bacterium]
ETMELFAPLANRLGIWQMKWELEDLSFRYLQPTPYHQIASMLAERRIDREKYIKQFVDRLDAEMNKLGIKASVRGRPKHIYGIWKKMQRKHKDFDQIYDVRAVRILVDDVRDCYAALGVVHSLWQYIPGEFDDYIATPKENNYRSIHTAVIGDEGKTVEVQIRSREMHKQSEYGVAAHWRYKEGSHSDQGYDDKIAWLRQLLEWKDELAGAGEFVDQFKSEVFSDRVYVFTPTGNIIDLPQGATPLDFAYRIHTEVGNRCRGARVDGHIVQLTYHLKTGEQVEVLSVKKGGPSRDWLNPHLGYLQTSRARSKVQAWFRHQDYEKNVDSGRTSLERELRRLSIVGISHEQLAHKMNFDKADELYAAIGRGDIKTARPANVAHAMTAKIENREVKKKEALHVVPETESSDAICIHGVGNLMTHLSRCCRPVPGEPIVGYITRGRGVSIHRQDCPNVLRYTNEASERLIEVNWGSRLRQTYPVDIQIEAYDRSGLLRDITNLLSNEDINVITVNTRTDKRDNMAYMTLTAEIPDIDMLSKVLVKIERLPNVVEVRRRLS